MEEQDRLLEGSTLIVREQSYFMKKAIEQENMREALKYASNMLSELRSVNLSPRFYYELYMQIFQELQGNLYEFFNDHSKHGKRLSELYETAQHAGNILPRLYLVLTVGVSYMESREITSPIEILYDMVELCKGVQHPIRGLFLRYFLLQMTKDKLMRLTEIEMQTGNYASNPEAIIEKVCDYLLLNFRESTRLWNRLMDPVATARKEKERYDLRLLVGTSLVGISQLEGVTQSFYIEKVLPRILDQVIECNKIGDFMAAQYILDCTVQIFPDEFHLESLQLLLSICSQLDHASVDLRPILTNLMNRLGVYLAAATVTGPSPSGRGADDEEVFGLFKTYLEKILVRSIQHENQEKKSDSSTKSGPLAAILQLYNSFLNFTMASGGGTTATASKCFIVNRISVIHTMTLSALNKYITLMDCSTEIVDDDEECRHQSPAWMTPLLSIIETTLLHLDLAVVMATDLYAQFSMLVRAIPTVYSHEVLVVLLDSVLSRLALPVVASDGSVASADGSFSSATVLRRFLDLVAKLVSRNTDHRRSINTKLCKVLRYLVLMGQDGVCEYNVYEHVMVAKTHLDAANPTTVYDPQLKCMMYMQLAALCLDGLYRSSSSSSSKKLFQLTHALLLFEGGSIQMDDGSSNDDDHHGFFSGLSSLMEKKCDMWLAGCILAHRKNMTAISVEFLTQCVLLFEDGDVLLRNTSSGGGGGGPSYLVSKIIGVINILFQESDDDLPDIDRVALKVLQIKNFCPSKFDQCLFITNCSYLFMHHHNEQHLVDCLQKSLKLSDTVGGSKSLYLFVLLLNKYIYFWKAKSTTTMNTTTTIRESHIDSLVTLCKELARSGGHQQHQAAVISFLDESIAYYQHCRSVLKNS